MDIVLDGNRWKGRDQHGNSWSGSVRSGSHSKMELDSENFQAPSSFRRQSRS